MPRPGPLRGPEADRLAWAEALDPPRGEAGGGGSATFGTLATFVSFFSI